MLDCWWTALRGTTLRRVVVALLCLAMTNAFVAEGYAGIHDHETNDLVTNDHRAHAMSPHVHITDDGHGGGLLSAAHVSATHDCLGHAGDTTTDGDEQGPVSRIHCHHAHCCTAFLLPAAVYASATLIGERMPRPADEQASGLPSSSFDRPPIAIL